MRHHPIQQEDCRAELLAAGRTLFAKHGLAGTTVRDIAKRAKASTCLVSYYFGGKEGLYRACLEEFGKSRVQSAQGVLDAPESAEELRIRLKLLLGMFIDVYQNESDLVKLVLNEIEAGLPIARDIYESTFLKLSQKFIEFIRSAQKKGILRSDLDPFALFCMIQGTFSHFSRLEPVQRRYFDRSFFDPKTREKLLDTMLTVLLEGILEKE